MHFQRSCNHICPILSNLLREGFQWINIIYNYYINLLVSKI